MENSMLSIESDKRGFETLSVPYGKNGKEIRAIKVMSKKLKDKKIDIIYSNSNLDRTISAFTAMKIKCKNIASIHSCHSLRYNILHWYRNKYLIHHFITDGYSSKKILTDNDKIPGGKITVVHIGVDDSIAVYSEEKRKVTRNSFNIRENDIVLGIVARLVNFKGINILIDAFKILNNNKSDSIKLLIVGDGILMTELQHQSKRLGLNDKIIFTGFRADLDNLLSSMDIYVQPSLRLNAEIFPISAVLAKSVGLPMVVSDSGDLKYLVEENSDGFVVTPGDAVELAEKLLLIIKDNDLRKSMRIKSLENYRKKFTLKIMTSQILSVYEKVLSN